MLENGDMEKLKTLMAQY